MTTCSSTIQSRTTRWSAASCSLRIRRRARPRFLSLRTMGNAVTHNGLGGVPLHTHVGPALGLPVDDMSGNKIIGNTIAGNLADTFDTATPGRVGININSGDGGSPVRGTVISQNVISDEDIDIAVNTP